MDCLTANQGGKFHSNAAYAAVATWHKMLAFIRESTASMSDLPLHPLRSRDPLIVYIDFKSPYAYLAIAPTLALGAQLEIDIDWRPFELDIPSYLGSAKLDQGGKVVASNRSASQWSGVKYAYFDCRRYANLSGLTIRGTEKIWDTHLPAIGLLWVRQHRDAALLERYLRAVLQPFWRRELDVEDAGVIKAVLAAVGATVEGFDDFVTGDGKQANDELQAAAFAAGVFGVPSYVVNEEIFFGREHLPLIRSRLRSAVIPVDAAYELPPRAQISPVADGVGKELVVAIDFASPQSLLAIQPTLAFAAEHDLRLHWLPASGGELKPPVPAGPNDDRGVTHRRLRAQSRANYLALYARLNLAKPLRDLYAQTDTEVARAGLLFANKVVIAAAADPDSAIVPGRVNDYVEAVYQRFWLDGESIAELHDIEPLLNSLGIYGFREFWSDHAQQSLAENEQSLSDRAFISAPTYFFAGEPYVGREHLPLLNALLGAQQALD